MSVVEALSHGLPVICFDNYGPGESVDDLSGFRIKITDRDGAIKDFSACLTDVCVNDDLRRNMSLNARQRVRDNYLWSHRGDTLKEIYDQVIE